MANWLKILLFLKEINWYGCYIIYPCVFIATTKDICIHKNIYLCIASYLVIKFICSRVWILYTKVDLRRNSLFVWFVFPIFEMSYDRYNSIRWCAKDALFNYSLQLLPRIDNSTFEMPYQDYVEVSSRLYLF